MHDTKMVIAVRRDLNMRKGKLAAQVAHAASYFLVAGYAGGSKLAVELTRSQRDWLAGSHAKVVVGVDSEQELLDLVEHAKRVGVDAHAVVDAGRTEFHGVATLTCAAFGPDELGRLDAITGGLKLL